MATTETDRQTAAKCVARLFQGWGHELRKKGGGGMSYGKEGQNKLTDFEKQILRESFEYFLKLIQGDKMEDMRKDPWVKSRDVDDMR